jgi:hypothetical protein
LNTYAYVGGNPLRYIDPRGLAGAATGVLTGLGLDASTPDPTDAAWPKWVIWGATLGGAAAWDWMCNESADDTPNDSSNRSPNPFKGDPGSSSETTNPDGTPKQKRYYDDDGYPSKDIDYNHDHGQGKPHVHDWTRPSAGGPPTHKDRLPGRPPLPGED